VTHRWIVRPPRDLRQYVRRDVAGDVRECRQNVSEKDDGLQQLADRAMLALTARAEHLRS